MVAIVVLQNHVEKDFIALSRDDDRLRMQDLFVLAELLYKFFDAMFVEKLFYLGRVGTLIGQSDFETRIKKCQFAQTRCETLELKLGRNCEDCRIGKERDERPRSLFVFDFADDGEFVRRFALGESHVIDLAVARYFHLEPFRKSIRAFRTYAVQAARIFVGALS